MKKRVKKDQGKRKCARVGSVLSEGGATWSSQKV